LIQEKTSEERLFCPYCRTRQFVVKRGWREHRAGFRVQRYECKRCHHRFTLRLLQSSYPEEAIFLALRLRKEGLSSHQIAGYLRNNRGWRVRPATVLRWIRKLRGKTLPPCEEDVEEIAEGVKLEGLVSKVLSRLRILEEHPRAFGFDGLRRWARLLEGFFGFKRVRDEALEEARGIAKRAWKDWRKIGRAPEEFVAAVAGGLGEKAKIIVPWGELRLRYGQSRVSVLWSICDGVSGERGREVSGPLTVELHSDYDPEVVSFARSLRQRGLIPAQIRERLKVALGVDVSIHTLRKWTLGIHRAGGSWREGGRLDFARARDLLRRLDSEPYLLDDAVLRAWARFLEDLPPEKLAEARKMTEQMFFFWRRARKDPWRFVGVMCEALGKRAEGVLPKNVAGHLVEKRRENYYSESLLAFL
jgi:transposase-like protein